MSSDISFKTVEKTLFKKGERPYQIDEDVRKKLDGLNIDKFRLIKDLSKDEYESIRKIAPKLDKVSKNISLICVWNLLSITEFESYEDSFKRPEINLEERNDIFCTNGDTVSILKGFPGIVKIANIANVQIAYSKAKISEDDKTSIPEIARYDRFFDQLFGHFTFASQAPKDLENLAFKWYESYQSKKKVSLSGLTFSLKGLIGKNYAKFIKYVINENLERFTEIVTRTVKNTPLRRFIHEKFNKDNVKCVACKKISFSLGTRGILAIKDRVDLQKIDNLQEKISKLDNYEQARNAQDKLYNNVKKGNESLLKALIKRGNIYPKIDKKGKVIKTRNEILEDTEQAWLHAKSIELLALPYDEKYINSIIPGMKLKSEKFSINESYIKTLPQNIIDDICKVLGIDKIESQTKETAEKLKFKAINEDDYILKEVNEINDEE